MPFDPRQSPRSSHPDFARIGAVRFSPIVAEFIARYEAVAHRDAFLWRWAHVGIELTTLPSVTPALREHSRDTKLLAVILNVLLDDLADREDADARLDLALDLVEGRASSPELADPYLRLIADLWREIDGRARTLPRFDEHAALLSFDYRQVFNCMRYGRLLRTMPALNNPVEHDLYQPHNMNMMVFATLDLMASGPVDAEELGRLREAFACAQAMGQLSNMLVTWEREVPDRDFSSGIFTIARARKILSAQEFERLSADAIVARIHAAKIEEALLEQWGHRRACLQALADELLSVPLAGLLDGLERLLGMTLVSRGRL